MSNFTPRVFQNRLLKWYDQHGRKHLPWQKNKNPYRVWISEIMLQQTQVTTVVPYFERFILRFPNVQSLAEAAEDDLLSLWSGLGYYQRARNLHRAAIQIVKDFNGKFPSQFDQIEGLPGIGRSTAGAVLALGFKKKATILDGNVKRVLTRVYGVRGWSGDKKVSERLWKIAEQLTPAQRVGDYTQAIMDLGATLCQRSRPRCEECPMAAGCHAYLKEEVHQFPEPKPSKNRPVKEVTFIVLYNAQGVLLEKRPSKGVWGGLWSFPSMARFSSPDEVRAFCWDQFELKIRAIRYGKPFRHAFTHFFLDISPVFVRISKKITINKQNIWYSVDAPQKVGVPTPVAMVLDCLKSGR